MQETERNGAGDSTHWLKYIAIAITDWIKSLCSNPYPPFEAVWLHRLCSHKYFQKYWLAKSHQIFSKWDEKQIKKLFLAFFIWNFTLFWYIDSYEDSRFSKVDTYTPRPHPKIIWIIFISTVVAKTAAIIWCSALLMVTRLLPLLIWSLQANQEKVSKVIALSIHDDL